MHKNLQIKAELPPLPADYPISAEVVADSISPAGHRLTTLELVFPRYILAEFNTHRAFSRNSSSSRAIPTVKQLSNIYDHPVYPVRWGKNKSGMQAAKENLEGQDLEKATQIWNEMRDFVAQKCAELAKLQLHKQWASRPLEAFTTMKVLVSATDFDNFFYLRDHSDAQEEIAYLAQFMKTALSKSTPALLLPGEWHLPYILPGDYDTYALPDLQKISAARSARTSYKTQHGVTSTLGEDLEMFGRLTYGIDQHQDNPFHASPTEHQATPCSGEEIFKPTNFTGWTQFRRIVEASFEQGFNIKL